MSDTNRTSPNSPDSPDDSTDGLASTGEQPDLVEPTPSVSRAQAEHVEGPLEPPTESTTSTTPVTTPASPAAPPEDSPAPTPEAPEPVVVPVVPVAQSTPAPHQESAVTTTDPKVVYVSRPTPPSKKGARGVGAAVVLLATILFAAVYAGLVFLVSLIAPPVSANAALQYFQAPIFWIPIIVFALSYLLLVVIVNRAGWWAHVLGGFLIAVLVYVSFIGAALIMAEAVGGEVGVVGPIVLAQLTNPLGFAAAVAAREVPVWVGGIVARRGRKAAEYNTEAHAAYERDLEAHRDSVSGQTAV